MNTAVQIVNHVFDFCILGMVFGGIRMFRNPAYAKKGNLMAGIAMVLAAGLVLLRHPPQHPYVLIGSLFIGALAGIWIVWKITMIQIWNC